MSEFKLTPMNEAFQPQPKPAVELPSFSLDSSTPITAASLKSLPTLSFNGRKPSSDDDSDYDRQQIDTGDKIRQRIETSRGQIWLEGTSLLCGCPDCDATMSIRLLISAADCWRCHTSIMLNAEQQAAAEELLRQAGSLNGASRNGRPRRQETLPLAPLPARPVPARPEPETPKAEPAARRSPVENETVRSRRPTAGENMTRNRVRAIDQRLAPSTLVERMFQMTPAWLISFVIHFVALLLLALFLIPSDDDSEQITLSTLVRDVDEIGSDIKAVNEDNPEYDLPTPPDADVSDQNVRASLAKADQEARELRLDANPRAEQADLATVKKRLSTESGSNFKFAARDPRLRVDVIQKEGGTLLTEAAVARGLRWLADHQNHDGSWSLKNYRRSSDRNNRGDSAATSLALLPFLGAGQTHEYGIYKDTVARGLKWLIDAQQEDGDLRGSLKNSQEGMYAHGQGSIVLVEAFAMTGDERFRDPAQRAINFICKAQHNQGGWRYKPGDPGDTSVFGWQMMALQSASAPSLGLDVPESTLKLASYYLDLAGTERGSKYSYLPGNKNPTEVMTAEGLLCRMYLGWKRDDPRLRSGVSWLVNSHMPRKRNMYYWYYATQTLHHYGGPEWEKWNEAMREILVDLQEETGRDAGSWNPAGFQYEGSDRIYVTALAVCTLEVYYRHLPLFKQLDIDE